MHADSSTISSSALPSWGVQFTAPASDTSSGSQAGFELDTEWVLPDGLGGFAMGSIAGVPMRRYHGLLCASLSPPVKRTMMLCALDELVHIADAGYCGCDLEVRLTGFQFADQDVPTQNPHLRSFSKTTDSCEWIYEIITQVGPVHIRKTLTIADRLEDHTSACRVDYEIESGFGSPQDITIEIRPLVSMRDFHELNHEGSITADTFTAEPISEPATQGVRITRPNLDANLSIAGVHIDWKSSPSIWKHICYHHETIRGQDDREDLYCPGAFSTTFSSNHARTLSITATTSAHTLIDWQASSKRKSSRVASSIKHALNAANNPTDPQIASAIANLASAADDFVVGRWMTDELSTSILAGYPWFSDWGRDTMIALPGLLLCTGRFDEANQTLRTFAHAIKHGLIPNRFDDAGEDSHYNTVDASLWFIHACSQWSIASDRPLDVELIHACDKIIDAYIYGTINNIALDPNDGLIRAGDEHTQLTWMDALRNGIAFTPRHGKPIEINALWINALQSRLTFHESTDQERLEIIKDAIHRASASMISKMSKGPYGGLVDCLTPLPGTSEHEWTRSDELRPNQIFASSLPEVGLPTDLARASVDAVGSALLTPIGLRTLDANNPNYAPHYQGSMTDRDRAYHNGTAWPWLLGPYCEALMRVNNFDAPSRKQAQSLLVGLASKMDSDSVGQLFEIYDAQPDQTGNHRPQGCVAQAWSISETLRVLVLSCQSVNSEL